MSVEKVAKYHLVCSKAKSCAKTTEPNFHKVWWKGDTWTTEEPIRFQR